MNNFKKLLPTFFKLIIACLFIYPIFLILINSFKPYSEIMGNFLGMPQSISFDMYAETWVKMNFSTLFFNNIFYTITIVFIVVILSSMAGYKLARTKTRLSNAIAMLLLIPLMVPLQSFMMTMTKQASRLHMTGSRWGYVIIMAGLLIPFATFLIKNFMYSVPIELDECARIDGAGQFTIFARIVMPLLSPVITTVVVIDAISVWNEFFVQLLLLGGKRELFNIQYSLYSEFSTQASDWEHALPGLVISLIPIIIFFVVLQKQIVEGIASGAIKG